MPSLPTQVPWRRFVCVLRKLSYTAQKGKAGAARPFANPGRIPNVVSLREPHPGQNLRPPLCGSIFRDFSSMRMNSCGYSKTAKSRISATRSVTAEIFSTVAAIEQSVRHG